MKNHGEQTTYGTLFSLSKARDYGMIDAVIDYDEMKCANGDKIYIPNNIVQWPYSLKMKF